MSCAYSKLHKALRITCTWESDGSGDFTEDTEPFGGTIRRIDTIPSATAAPSLSYDISLTDQNSIGVLPNDDLADRNDAATETVYPAMLANVAQPFHEGPLTITVANAGDTKAGTIVILVDPAG